MKGQELGSVKRSMGVGDGGNHRSSFEEDRRVEAASRVLPGCPKVNKYEKCKVYSYRLHA